MEIYKMASTKEEALHVWEKKDYFNLSNFTFSDLINIFLSTDTPHRLFSRKRHYQDFYETFKDQPIREISFSILQKWFNKIQKNFNLTERTLKMIKSQLSPFFKWAINENIILANPLERIKFRGDLPPKKPRAILSQQEIMKIISDAKSFDEKTFYPFIFAIIHTGARRSEIMKLRWENIDLDEGFLTFHKTKNGESRKI